MSLVSFVRIRRNTIASMKQAIRESLDLINYSFNKEVKKIAIKPNMCYYWDYSTGQTTDPRFTAALIELLRERLSPDIDIAIVESDASAMKCKHVFKILGYEKLRDNYDVRLVNLSEDKCERADVNVAGESFRLMIPQTIQDADLRINIPKIKYTVDKINITCALKNIFGCNPYPKKFRYHSRLGEMIVAANKAMRFDLSIIDGNIVSGVQPRRIGLVMASADLVAIDVAAAEIAGLNSRTINYIQLARREGLGNTSFIGKGLRLAYFKRAYPKKGVKKKLLGKAYNLVTRAKLGARFGID